MAYSLDNKIGNDENLEFKTDLSEEIDLDNLQPHDSIIISSKNFKNNAIAKNQDSSDQDLPNYKYLFILTLNLNILSQFLI